MYDACRYNSGLQLQIVLSACYSLLGRIWHHLPVQDSLSRNLRCSKCATVRPHVSIIVGGRSQLSITAWHGQAEVVQAL